jgi:hypothetical protein
MLIVRVGDTYAEFGGDGQRDWQADRLEPRAHTMLAQTLQTSALIDLRHVVSSSYRHRAGSSPPSTPAAATAHSGSSRSRLNQYTCPQA